MGRGSSSQAGPGMAPAPPAASRRALQDPPPHLPCSLQPLGMGPGPWARAARQHVGSSFPALKPCLKGPRWSPFSGLGSDFHTTGSGLLGLPLPSKTDPQADSNFGALSPVTSFSQQRWWLWSHQKCKRRGAGNPGLSL